MASLVIRRGEQAIVRLRDLEHPALQAFHGVPAYPVDSVWRFRARFEPTEGKKIAIVNILGQTNWQDSPGSLVFEHQGKTYRLDALREGHQFFLLFADETNGVETYGAGLPLSKGSCVKPTIGARYQGTDFYVSG